MKGIRSFVVNKKKKRFVRFIKRLVIFECKRDGLSLALIRMKFGYVSTTASLSLGDSGLSRPNRRWCSKDKVSRQVRGGLGIRQSRVVFYTRLCHADSVCNVRLLQ